MDGQRKDRLAQGKQQKPRQKAVAHEREPSEDQNIGKELEKVYLPA
jgi:hypothetical protein